MTPGVVGTVWEEIPPTVLLSLILFLIGKGFRLTTSKAIRSAVLFGVGIRGLMLIGNVFSTQIAPLVARFVSGTGLSLSAVDLGWPVTAAIAFGTAEIGLWMIPVFVLLNLLLFRIGFTHTLNVDVWNYWHFSFVSALLYVKTGSFWYAWTGGLIMGLFVLVAADWTQPAIEETFDTPGTSIPHGFSPVIGLAALPVNTLIERTPLGTIEVNSEWIQDRLGPLGEPVYLGFFLSLFLTVGAYGSSPGPIRSWTKVLGIGLSFLTIIYVIPKIGSILVEALTPLSQSVRSVMTDRFEHREPLIGLDSAVLVGHPSVTTASLIMVPIALVMMVVLPGNDLLWGVDLATFPFFLVMMVPYTNGNVVKMVANGTVLLVPVHYIASAIAGLYTEAAVSVGFPLENHDTITSMIDAGSPATGILVLFGPPWGLLLGLIIVLALFVALRTWPLKMYRIAGASEDKAQEAVKHRHRGESPGIIPDQFGSGQDVDSEFEDSS